MVFLTQIIPCLHMYPQTRALANREVSGAHRVSAELAASEKKKHDPIFLHEYFYMKISQITVFLFDPLRTFCTTCLCINKSSEVS